MRLCQDQICAFAGSIPGEKLADERLQFLVQLKARYLRGEGEIALPVYRFVQVRALRAFARASRASPSRSASSAMASTTRGKPSDASSAPTMRP